MGPYEKMAFDKEKALKEETFQGKKMSDEEYNGLIKRIDKWIGILSDDKLFEEEYQKHLNSKNE